MTLNSRAVARAAIRDITQSVAPTERKASYMLAWGDYRFSVDTAAYQSLTRDHAYLWPTQKRFGSASTPQFTGLGDVKRSLSGVIYPEYKGGLKQFDAMAAQAGTGIPYLMVLGTGDVLGFWCMTTLRETATVFHSDGQARRLEFNAEFIYYGDTYSGS